MTTRRLILERLTVRGLRNLEAAELEPSPGVTVISGDNGHGKTSLLEALYLGATTRSFRTDRPREIIRDGSDHALVRLQFDEEGLAREQRVLLRPTEREVLADGKRPERLAAFATRLPVVVFHPGDLALVSGAASLRRTLLDRIALFTDPSSSDARLGFQRALKERQRSLELGQRGSSLDAYEAVCAERGALFQAHRRRAAEALGEALERVFGTLAAPNLPLAVRFRPGGSDDVDDFRRQLEERRAVDARRRTATFGPQRDELELELGGRSARKHASQGQQRITALALKLAELGCVRAARGAHPLLLLDDVSSELDPHRSGAVTASLLASESQVLVTTTRPELLPSVGSAAPRERRDVRLVGGRLEQFSP